MTEYSDRDNFFSFFQDRLDFVKSNCMGSIEGTILLCSYIDSLARYRYGGRSNENRFKRFLINGTEQADVWRKVSLILLRQHFESKNLNLYSRSIDVLDRLGARTTNFTNLNHNPDVSLEMLLSEYQKELLPEEIKLLNEDFKQFEYSAILWKKYRNPSIHETSIHLNQAMNIVGHNIPFYSNRDTIQDGKIVSTHTCFSIPSQFLIATIESGLKTIKKLVDSGELVFSQPHQFEASDEPRTNGSDTVIQYPRMITKPFLPFLRDRGNLLEQAKKDHDLFASTNDGVYRWREATMSRSAIVISVFCLESVINCVLGDFKCREAYQLPDVILTKTGLIHQPIERLPLIERVYLAPYICCQDEVKILKGFFNRGSTEFQKLKELIEIRDSFAHGRPVYRRLHFFTKGEGNFFGDDQFPENFWSVTKFPKDFFSIDCKHASQANEIIEWTILQLDRFLDGQIARDNWMSNEKVEFDPSKQPLQTN